MIGSNVHILCDIFENIPPLTTSPQNHQSFPHLIPRQQRLTIELQIGLNL